MRVALYARVSTADQDPEPQLRELLKHAERQGWEIVLTYTNIVRGTKAERPELDLLMTAAHQWKFDTVCVRKLDRFGQARYREAYEKGQVGKTVHSRSGKNLPPYYPKRIFGREKGVALRRQGLSLRQIASGMGLGLGAVSRTLQGCFKSC